MPRLKITIRPKHQPDAAPRQTDLVVDDVLDIAGLNRAGLTLATHSGVSGSFNPKIGLEFSEAAGQAGQVPRRGLLACAVAENYAALHDVVLGREALEYIGVEVPPLPAVSSAPAIGVDDLALAGVLQLASLLGVTVVIDDTGAERRLRMAFGDERRESKPFRTDRVLTRAQELVR